MKRELPDGYELDDDPAGIDEEVAFSRIMERAGPKFADDPPSE